MEILFPIYPSGDKRGNPHLLEKIPQFPELIIKYLEGHNHLCPTDKYKTIVCFWEGDLELTIEVNETIIKLNDHDEKKNESATITVGNNKYIFQGTMRSSNSKHSLQQTMKESNSDSIVYIKVKITKIPITTAHQSIDGITRHVPSMESKRFYYTKNNITSSNLPTLSSNLYLSPNLSTSDLPTCSNFSKSYYNLPSLPSLPTSNLTSSNLPACNLPVPASDSPVPAYNLSTAPNLPSPNLPSSNLPACNLPACNLPSSNLPSSNLPAVNLPFSNLVRSNLPSSNLPASQLNSIPLSSDLSLSSSLLPGNNDSEFKHYHLGQPFIIELYANASTGYNWHLGQLKGLEIIFEGSWSPCSDGKPGCGGYKYWLVKGTQKGSAIFRAKYVRSWEDNRLEPEREIKFIIE